jgi:hypothetical protein
MQALVQIAKGGGLGLFRLWTSLNVGGFRRNGGSVMRSRVDIDEKTSRAITREIGERLQTIVRVDPKVPASLGKQLGRLRELEGETASIVPAVEHGFENTPPKDVSLGDRIRFTWLWRRKS